MGTGRSRLGRGTLPCFPRVFFFFKMIYVDTTERYMMLFTPKLWGQACLVPH